MIFEHFEKSSSWYQKDQHKKRGPARTDMEAARSTFSMAPFRAALGARSHLNASLLTVETYDKKFYDKTSRLS